ncbi:hypothetical protein KCU65_g9054, partial [Aureobasidium melanogenum]
MSEWRDRGYVPDSDEDDISLVGDENIDTNITPTPPSTTTIHNQRCASVELVDDQEDENAKTVPKAQEPVASAPTARPIQASDEEINQDTTFDLPQDDLDARHTSQQPSAGQPIVLITQSRRADSPPEENNNVRTYSRKSRPGALKSIKRVNTNDRLEEDVQKDDGFMDIDELVTDHVEPEQDLSSSAPLVAPPQAERRLSVSSSDLSDVDMQIISSPQPFFPLPTSTARTNDSIPRLPSQPEATALESAITSLSDEHLAALAAQQPRRNLRARKAIQLHPYLLEVEQYRRALKARGLRPIQVATSSQRPRNQDDSQDGEFHQEESQPRRPQLEHTQESTPPDSSASSVHNPPSRLDLSNLITGDDEEEFPDIDAALRRHVIGGTQIQYKRRKTLETPDTNQNGRMLPSSRARGKLKSLSLNRVLSTTSGRSNQDLLPLSPPRTSSPANAESTPVAPPRFRLPHGVDPTAVPTPLPSSPEPSASTSARRPRQVVISSDEEAVSHQDIGAESSSSSESDQVNRQLQLRYSRKIRGVLPASYLKLDRQIRQRSPSIVPSEAQSATPRPTAPVRGVAQRRVTSTSATPARQNSYVIFSDNSESDSSVPELPASRLLQTRLPSPITGRPSGRPFEPLEVDEHDEIDAMLPTNGRARFREPGGKKRQSKLPSTFIRTKSSNQAQSGQERKAPGHPTAQKSTSRHEPGASIKRKPAAKKPKPVKLSILDATTSNDPKSPRAVSRPQFVRLAARQARNRPDHGRHSPSNKDIRLATREDTQDALEPLLSWRAGNLSRSWVPPPHNTHSSDDVRNDEDSRMTEVSNDQENTVTTGGPQHRRPGQPRQLMGTKSRQSRQPQEKDNLARKRTARDLLRANQRKLLERNHRMRPAQLESVAQSTHLDLDPLTSAAPPSRLMEIFARDRRDQPASKFRLERFLKDKGDLSEVPVPNQSEDPDTNMTGTDNVVSHSRTRKRLARRIDIETTRFRQPNEPLPADVPSVSAPDSENITSTDPPEKPILQGLGSFGTRYPTDFDVRPLEIGTYFATDTFVGSGDFNDCLTLRKRDLDVPAGRITVEVAGRSLHWSAWNEDVSAGLDLILSACTEDLHSIGEYESTEMRRTAIEDTTARFNYFLRSIVRYLSGCLHFLDSIDRSSSLSRLSRFVDEFLDMVEVETIILKSHFDIQAHVERFVVDSFLYLLCLTVQSVRISHHPAADSRLQTVLMDKSVRLSTKIIAAALPPRLTPVREFLETHREHARRESGIQAQDIPITSIVIVNHALTTVNASTKLSDIISTHLGRSITKMCNIHSLDQIWYDAFCLQPLLEIDAKGIYRPRSRFQSANDSWNLVKMLLQRTFELYPATSKARSPTLNDYVRACLTRVYHLITRWSWRRCETALSTIYDFFAGNNLSQLHKEEGKGSPCFLEDLDKDPAIDLEASDCAFHIFLKLLVVGLRGLQEILPKNKVRGFAWRFIPNHGRTYRKEQEVTHIALNALRNHHDLLCTLYWVMPSGCGPRLQMIKDLVDHDNSHREACRLSVHAWGMLARYQFSQGETFNDQDVLASWYRDMVSTTISQYRLARSEAEAQYTAARSKGSSEITPEMLEMTITANQRSIFAILQDLLLAMRNAVKISKLWSAVRNVIEQSNVIEVLKLFDMDQPRLSVAIVQALDVVDELLVAKTRLCKPIQQESQPGSDDSQDYGDWSFMEQVIEEPENSEPKASEVAFLQEPLASLLSTCFGSEKSPDDALLKKIVDTWVTTAQHLINENVLDWSSFLDVYSTSSWFQLRDTEQRHKYTCYFLASVIKSDKSSLTNHRTLFMKAWFVALFERESKLKFQHRLTVSLLEKTISEPLLHNLPFAANHETGEYRITLTEFRERRIGLVSSVLSNMHTSLNSFRSSTMSESKREYVDMLKAAMQHMRSTYEQLQNMSGRLGGSSYDTVKGAYVEFVQSTISLMQQYTSDICPIDPFFVDSAAFPLPLDDPTYVKAKLKSYDSKLEDSRARKQLAVFVQTVSERAASENQQPYLTKQMHDALIGDASRGLRSVVLTALLPAYIHCSNNSAPGCAQALPLLQASAMVICDMIYDLDLTDGQAVDSDVDAITSIITTACHFAMSIPSQPTLQDIGSLRLFAAIFHLAEQSLTFVEYVYRATGKASGAMELLRRLMASGKEFSTRVMDPFADVPISPDAPTLESVHCPWQDTLDFATRNLTEPLARAPSRNWDTDFESVEVESMRVVAAFDYFRRSYNVIICRGKNIVQSAVDGDEVGEDEDEETEEQDLQRQGLDKVMTVIMRYHTRNSKGAEELWDVTHPDDGSDMSANDRKFCKYIMAQLERPENKHFTEPFDNTFNLPAYQGFARHADLSSIKNDVHTDFYGNLNEFKEDFQRIVNNCKAVEKDDKGLFYDKANDLQHHLVKLFEQKKSLYTRWDKEREQECEQEREQEQSGSPSAAPAAPSPASTPAAAIAAAALAAVSASAPVASSSSAGPVAASRPPSPSPHPSTMQNLPHRFSATPAPLHRPTNDSEGRFTEVQANNTRGPRQSSRAELVIASREVGETLDHDAELRQVRAGKKRAASGDEIVTDFKRARQETPKHKYRNLRVEIAGVFDREMELVHAGGSTTELDEGAQRYVDHLSQMDAGAMQKARMADLNEIKEDYVGELEEVLVELAQNRINGVLGRKGQSIQPRMSLSSKMEDEEDDNEARVKRE